MDVWNDGTGTTKHNKYIKAFLDEPQNRSTKNGESENKHFPIRCFAKSS